MLLFSLLRSRAVHAKLIAEKAAQKQSQKPHNMREFSAHSLVHNAQNKLI